jgi:hypothetical protein
MSHAAVGELWDPARQASCAATQSSASGSLARAAGENMERHFDGREVLGMRLLRPSSEAEMVALFLRTELPSDRWGEGLRALLERAGLPERVISAPDLGDEAENQARPRLRLLTEQRGYGTRTELFDGFPDDVRWQWMAITPAELASVRYIEYDYWIELSGGTRLAVDAAARIRAGVTPFGVSGCCYDGGLPFC